MEAQQYASQRRAELEPSPAELAAAMNQIGGVAMLYAPKRSFDMSWGLGGGRSSTINQCLQRKSIANERQAEQQQIQSSRLAPASRCLQGSWLLTSDNSDGVGATLDITDTGLTYMEGQLLSHQANSSARIINNVVSVTVSESDGQEMTQRLRLEGEYLLGAMTFIRVKKGFLRNQVQPPETRQLRGERISTPPEGCGPAATSSNSDRTERAKSIADGLNDLSQLYNDGLLNEAEFSAAKRRLLGL
jgi:hypothetical protein